VAEALTAFLSIEDPLHDETEDALEEAFGDLEVNVGGIGELVGWDVDADGVQVHLLADEPERVIAVLVETLHALGARPPTKLVASDPASGTPLYERWLA
jgi:hypothetical protein